MRISERKAIAGKSHRKAHRLWRYCATAAVVISQAATAVSFVFGFNQTPRSVSKVHTAAVSGHAALTVAVLKEKLRERGLSTSGLKSVLVQRLEEELCGQ
eukprot:Skav231936  [mRNA]  locus=scaffold2283:36920:37893:- [translate_table: standard]